MSTAAVNVPVPSSGFGAPADVSALTGSKTVTLSGTFSGSYVLYGSHNNSNFAPLMIFDSGGVEEIQQEITGALSSVQLLSNASNASGVAVNISGFSNPGTNSFDTLPLTGSSGPQASLDLGTTNYQSELNFIAVGGLNGNVIVEGSPNNTNFNPIGSFSGRPSTTSLVGKGQMEFSPLTTTDKVRYVRLNVKGTVSSFTVTVGGAQDPEDIAAGSITNAKLAPAPSHTLKGNNTAFPVSPSDLTVGQVITLLNLDTLVEGNMPVFVANTATIQPGTDLASKYVFLSGMIIPANSTLNIGVAGPPSQKNLLISCRALTLGHTITLVNLGPGGGNLGPAPLQASLPQPIGIWLYFDGLNWIFNGYVDLNPFA